MKHTLLIAGAAALIAAAPALAKPGNGQGQGKGQGHSKIHGNAKHVDSKHAAKVHDNHGKGTLYGYGRGGCPPGLAKKNNGCMPPGQFKKLFSAGQILPATYGNRWSFNQIPTDLRANYGFRPNARYYYGDGYLYQVDPRTMLIQRAVNAIVR
jgi:hypothetical protein